MSSDSRLWDLTLPSVPSEIIVFPGLPSVCVVGDLAGTLQSFDLSCIPKLGHLTGSEGFKQPTSVILSHSNADVFKIIALKVGITSLSAPPDGNSMIAGTSSGDIFIIAVEPTQIRRWRSVSTGLKTTSVQKVCLHTIAKEPKAVSIDWLSAVSMQKKIYIFANTRSENAALLMSQDVATHCQLVKTFRVPSLRAKCPVAIHCANDHWTILAGTDVGDLILCEENGVITSLPFHESTVTVVEWLQHGNLFISGDVSGLLSLWSKT
jgi:WD40 repeat protein